MPPIQRNYNAATYSPLNTMQTPVIYSQSHIGTQLDTNSNQERRTVSVGSGGDSVINQGGSLLGVHQQVPNGMSINQGNAFVNGNCDGIATPSSTLTTEDRSFGTTDTYGQGVPTSLVPDNVPLPCGVGRSGTSVVPGTAINNGHLVSHFVVLLFILVLLLMYMNTL